MSFEPAFKLSSYLLVADGLFALWLTRLFHPFSFGLILLVFVTVYKLFNRQQTRHYLDLYLLSFFQLVAASAFTVSVSFLAAFLLFLLLGTWTLILFHLRKEAETCGAKEALLAVHAPLLSGPFLLCTLGAALGLNLKWRGIALDRFDGRSWSSTPTSQRVIVKQREGMFQVQRVEGEPVLRQQIYLEPIETEALFSAPNAVAIAVSASALRVDELGSISLSAPPPTRIAYLALSALREDPGESLSARAWRASIHLPTLPPRIRLLADSLVQDATTPYEKSKRIEAPLRTHYRYSLDVPHNQALYPLEDFLFETRAGHCEYFAASMAVLLRMVGVPSRVVNGFQRGEWNEFGRYFTVRQEDAHSWVEAYVGGRGWMSFDPSSRGTVATDGSRTLGLLVRFYALLSGAVRGNSSFVCGRRPRQATPCASR